MIFTSYFAKYKLSNSVSIARFAPKGYTGDSYPDLYPTQMGLLKFKNGIWKFEDIAQEYRNLILETLDIEKVYRDLDGKVLLCYEKNRDFCHRSLVAKWIFDKLKIEVTEWESEKEISLFN